jgi:hypothetical protein
MLAELLAGRYGRISAGLLNAVAFIRPAGGFFQRNLLITEVWPSGLLFSRRAHVGEEEFGLAVGNQGYPHCRWRCQKRLADPETTDAERELLLKLLAEEEAKDVRDADGHRPIPSEVRPFLHSQDG